MVTPNAHGSSTPHNATRTVTPHNVPDAAFAAATRAFAKPPAKPKHLVSPYSGRNGAFAAAKFVNANTPKRPPTPPRTLSNASRISLNSARYEGYIGNDIGDYVLISESPNRSVPTIEGSNVAARPSFPVGRSHSVRAASLAFGNSTPKPSRAQSPNIPIILTPPGNDFIQTIRTKAKRRSPSCEGTEMENEARRTGLVRATDGHDETPIPAAKSLVRLFEQQPDEKAGTKPMVGRKPSLAAGKPPPIIAPKPQRAIPIHSVSSELRQSEVRPPLPKRASTSLVKASGQITNSSNDIANPISPKRTIGNGNANQDLEERPPLPKRASTLVVESPGRITNSSNASSASLPLGRADTGNSIQQRKPHIPPPRRAVRQQSNASNYTDPIKSPSSPRRSSNSSLLTPQLPLRRLSKSPSFQIREDLASNPNRNSPAPYQERSLQRISPHITGESLANAMVGANLALRMNSPPRGARSTTPPPPPPPRRKGHHHITDHLHRSRSLSPVKRGSGMMMQSLRPEVQDREKEKKLSKHKYHQPNKHHEGTRERWRDELTDEELRRFEGVWAANKGLFVESEDPSSRDWVQNLVVKDIWSRSDLPPERLAGVWRLVATHDENVGRGRLNREQFVVGMWLVDQCLNGRNLPHHIPQTVWTSVRLRGVKVKLEGRGADGRKLERGALF